MQCSCLEGWGPAWVLLRHFKWAWGIPIPWVDDRTNVSLAYNFMYITKPIVHYNAHLNLETRFSIDQELVANHYNLNCLDPIVHFTCACKSGGQHIYFECGHLCPRFLKKVHFCCFGQLYVYNVIMLHVTCCDY